jgi:hypothetical protein
LATDQKGYQVTGHRIPKVQSFHKTKNPNQQGYKTHTEADMRLTGKGNETPWSQSEDGPYEWNRTESVETKIQMQNS